MKHINDSLGHTYGDKLLIQMGNLLKNQLYSETIARYGGDEFVVLIENTTEKDVKTFFSKIRRAIDKYNQSNPILPIELSIRMGIFTPFDWTYVKNLQKRR